VEGLEGAAAVADRVTGALTEDEIKTLVGLFQKVVAYAKE
jgi:hypothetical protein